MKNFTELTKNEQQDILDMLPHEMNEEQKVQFCQFVQDRYNVSDYFEEYQMLERLSYMLKCHRDINKDCMDPAEKEILFLVCQQLELCSMTLYRLFHKF